MFPTYDQPVIKALYDKREGERQERRMRGVVGRGAKGRRGKNRLREMRLDL